MMLAPSLCGAIVAVLLLPFCWTIAASALRTLLHRRTGAGLSDRVEKLVLALLLAPSAMGLAALTVTLLPATQSPLPPLPDFGFDDGVAAAPIAATHAVHSAPFPWLQAGISAFTWLYVAGALIAASRVIAAHVRIRHVSARATDASALWGKGVVVTSADTPPFVAGGGRIVLPCAMIDALAPAQVVLVIAHERAHVRRGDTFYYALLAWADALFWFNPLVRAQTQRCRLAAELACDASVTAAAPEMRRAYAQALISALKHTAGDALQCAPAVFSTRIVGEHRMRISEIMHGASRRRKRSAWAVYLAACVVAAPLGALQVALAQTNAVQPAVVAQAASIALFSVRPIRGDIVSGFGTRVNPNGGGEQFHDGVDYRASEGAEIVAPAPGRVTRVETYPKGRGKWLEVDHGGGVTTQYWHLSAFDVAVGQEVAGGQIIGRVGSTGRSTGPHLHFMVLRDGRPIDPETVLPHYTP